MKSASNQLEENFRSPPESTKPWVYWYWVNDHISKEGITKDLEAMAEAGIGQALIGNILDETNREYVGNVSVLSDEWWSCVEHAIREAERLGIKVGMFNCPGWSQSGGPWVKPEEAMRYLHVKEYRVSGGKKPRLKLENPVEHFQRVAIQAYPAPACDDDHITTKQIQKITSSAKGMNPRNLFEGDKAPAVKIGPGKTEIEILLKKPVVLRSMQLRPVEIPMTSVCRLLAKNTRGQWTLITEVNIDRGNLKEHIGPLKFGPVCAAFPEVTAKKLRLVFDSETEGMIGGVELGGASRISHYVEKQLGKMSPRPTITATSYAWEKSHDHGKRELVIPPGEITDLSPFVSNNELIWNAPSGDWIIQHTGMVPTGTKNNPTFPAGEGYEIDKMSREIAGKHFDSYVGQILKRIPPSERSGFRHVIADSYEQGSQNWTDKMRETFLETYDYDPIPWLPVLSGRVVGSADLSERFLWDLRRLVADKIASEYVGGLRDKCEENGLRLWLENYGHWGFPGEFLNYGGASHDLGGEFWHSWPELGPVECRCASSAAHTYGKSVVSAEAFTSQWTFNVQPRDFKIRGDWSWTQGINHFVLHLYIHQPDETKPGINAWFGTDFNRHNTWFGHSKSYFDYIRRSCALLQSGIHVADVAYFIGEDVPIMTGAMEPALPTGYDYDFVNAEVLRDARVDKNGRIVLKSGAYYRLLVLPKREAMRPELLSKLRELVSAGAAILGEPPSRSPSLKNYPRSDKLVAKTAGQLWGNQMATERKVGKGKVFSGVSIETVFEKLKVVPAVTAPAEILHTQRRDGATSLFFLTNQTDKPVECEVAFRVQGMQPELWDAVTREIRPITDFRQENGKTIIPMEFAGGDSSFVVFRSKAGKRPPVRKPNANTYRRVKTLTGNWSIAFDTAYQAPASLTVDQLFDWTSSDNPAVKYYSGTAVYSSEFRYDGKTNIPLLIDLGVVDGLATININGMKLETLWRYPYRSEVSGHVKKGVNKLEVEVVNCWWNRLIGDQQPGAKPLTKTAFTGWKATSPLQPSGLKGPVGILTRE
jgi:alpha-L-rhamnosidase